MIYDLSLLLPVAVAHKLCRASGHVRKRELDMVLSEMEKRLRSVVGVRVPLKEYDRVPFFLAYFKIEGDLVKPRHDKEYMEQAVKWHLNSLAHEDRKAYAILAELVGQVL